MVIYALQHCTPPVLPCLQDIGEWPLTTATASELTVPYGEVEGWPFSFHPIENLQPSSNQQGLGLSVFIDSYAKPGCKKCKANQKQHCKQVGATKNFDIS